MPRETIPKSLFGLRLREARNRVGIAQDKLGVAIGMDEGSSSARISRYETGIHEPPFPIAQKLALALKVPVAYFYCDDNRLANFLVQYESLSEKQKAHLLASVAQLNGQ